MIILNLTYGSYLFVCYLENGQTKRYQVKRNVLFLADDTGNRILSDFVNSVIINNKTVCFLNSGNIVHIDHFDVIEIQLPDLIYRISEELGRPEMFLYGLRNLSDEDKERMFQIIAEELGF